LKESSQSARINRKIVIDINGHDWGKKTLQKSEKNNRNKIKESKEKPGGSETILVVDEDKMARRFAIKELSKLGYTLLEAEDGRDALEIIKKNPEKINLLLTNVIMPEANGVQLYRQIKEFDPEMRAIFMLRFTEDFMIYHSIPADGKDGINFLRKFNVPQTLAKKVRNVLDS
jgi:CheY-like chemotaxis protein